MTEPLRKLARHIFDAGVAAADPYAGVLDVLSQRPVAPGTPMIAVGKAALRMAEAARASCDLGETIIATNPENAHGLPGAQVFSAAHPVPDENGLAASEAVEDLLRQATEDVLVLVSGGGSALLPAPALGLTLADKAAVNEALLASGAEITEINLVRQNLSRLKGGGMLRAAAPARVRALILSDVIGDDLRTIASGPTVAPLGSKSDARAILTRHALWEGLPVSVRSHLQTTEPPSELPEADNTLVGSNGLSVFAMMRAAQGHGYDVHMHAPPLTGDVDEAARRVAGTTDPGIHLFGGETTVQLAGTGKGGRNQELALRVALYLERDRRPWVYLQGGSDGRDGPTDAAGGLVDANALAEMRKRVDVEALLANNDAYPALKAGNALLVTGGTGTNVADLGVLIRG